jgi:hypothetical protein
VIDRNQPLIITGTTPSSAGVKAIIGKQGGLGKFDSFVITAALVGATGGVLDISLQRRVTAPDAVTPLWSEYARFTQLTAGGAAVVYTLSSAQAATTPIVTSLWADDAQTGALTLTTNTCVGGHPGDAIRVVAISGASTSAGALVTVYVMGIKTFT